MNGDYDNFAQHDCQEFLRNLLHRVHNENNRPKVVLGLKKQA